MPGERTESLNSLGGASRTGQKSAVIAAAALASRRAQNQANQTKQGSPTIVYKTRPRPQRAPSEASMLSNKSISSQKTITDRNTENPPAKDAAKAAAGRTESPQGMRSKQTRQPQHHQLRMAAAAASVTPLTVQSSKPPRKPIAAAAAARSFSLNPVKVEPRAGLQDKLLQALSQVRTVVGDDSNESVELRQRENRSPSNMAARLSTQLVPRVMTAPPPQQSALAAAALAKPQAESKFAEIDLNVKQRQDRKRRKYQYQPAASWSATAPPSLTPGTQTLGIAQKGFQSARKSFSSDGRIDITGTSGSEKPHKISHVMHKLGLKKAPNPTASSPTQPNTIVMERSTMRKDKRTNFNEHKPWKHHHDAKMLTEKERKRYERLWAANKGAHVPYSIHEPVHDIYSSQTESVSSLTNSNIYKLPNIPRITVTDDHVDAPNAESMSEMHDSGSVRSLRSSLTSESDHYDPQLDDICGYVVANIWRRSHLPDDTLAQIWNLVDNNHDGSLDRESFIVGTWLVDQCLYGRKLPSQISDQIWSSSGRLNVKIRVKQKNHKFRRSYHSQRGKKYGTANAAAILATRERSSTPQSAA